MVLLGSLRILLLDLSSGQITVISTLERVDKIRQQSFQVYLIINPPHRRRISEQNRAEERYSPPSSLSANHSGFYSLSSAVKRLSTAVVLLTPAVDLLLTVDNDRTPGQM